MPRVNLYVRIEDYEAYKKIKDKPQWLSEAIASYFKKELNKKGHSVAVHKKPKP